MAGMGNLASERLFPVHFGGRIVNTVNDQGGGQPSWVPAESVMAMAYDYLVPGYQNGYVNTLRLWSAKSTRDFNLQYFNEGDYVQAVADKNSSEMISKVLYPNDNNMAGKELRLKQEYFFVSATLQDVFAPLCQKTQDWSAFSGQAAIQMNDTSSRHCRGRTYEAAGG
jgi:starch phosphorylase